MCVRSKKAGCLGRLCLQDKPSDGEHLHTGQLAMRCNGCCKIRCYATLVAITAHTRQWLQPLAARTTEQQTAGRCEHKGHRCSTRTARFWCGVRAPHTQNLQNKALMSYCMRALMQNNMLCNLLGSKHEPAQEASRAGATIPYTHKPQQEDR